MDRLWAHSANARGVRHGLDDHLRGTAERARQFGAAFGAADLAWYLGLVHDVGKASCMWQQRLLIAERAGSRVGLDHKSVGTWLAARSCGPFAGCVYGHHGGLPAAEDVQRWMRAPDGAAVQEWTESVAALTGTVPELDLPAGTDLVPRWLGRAYESDPTAPDMLSRMLFSALVDADFLDTEQHFHGTVRPGAVAGIGEFASRYEAARARLLAERAEGPSPVDAWREDVYAMAQAAAGNPPGMYRFPSPTGSGKTIAAGGFAVHHARKYGLRRVIVAVPFISITEQNADVYRQLLEEAGQEVVLEHHSEASLDGGDAATWWSRLAAENWDAPFIVTTTAQLFQSLFDHRPAAMRKLHRLARSVIVLDEVQALPDRLLLPILSALRILVDHFGTTVLLASATQPSFWNLAPFRDLQVCNVIKDPEPLYDRFRRVAYQWQLDPRPTLAQIAAEAARERQVLVVVNTTSDSAMLHRHLEQHRDGACLHLSTRMTSRHRRDVLAQVRGLLNAGDPVAVVSTQLIEAGVDLDFPVVYRAWAPADSLQQAAGRANRNGRLAEGRVVVFDPEDGHQPKDRSYEAALNATGVYFGPGKASPDDVGQLDRYYRHRYSRQNLDETGEGAEIQRLRERMDFPRVAEDFRLIEERTVPVAVRYPEDDGRVREDLERIVTGLRSPDMLRPGDSRKLLRELRPFLASIPRRLARQAQACQFAEPIIGDVLEWHGPYSRLRGIDPADLSQLSGQEVFVW
jgi:CRISPR-associated endonuclease/helicase Cas3